MILFSGLFMLWTAHFWEVERVEIKGATANTEAHLNAFVEAEQLQGKHLLRINPLTLRAQLEQSPLIKYVALEREILPAVLTLKVQERLPRYFLHSKMPVYDKNTKKYSAQSTALTVIDGEGFVLPLASQRFEYAGPEMYLKPSVYQDKISEQHLNIVRVLDGFYDKQLLNHVGVFDISDPKNLVFHLAEPALKVWLGIPEDLILKMQLIESTYQASEAPQASIDYIDLRFWDHPVVRKRD